MSGIKVKLASRSNYLRDSEYTLADEALLYEQLLQDIYDNPRWYLDNFQELPEFRLSWANYRTKTPILPYKYVEKQKQ
jgi:hypothetical protein